MKRAFLLLILLCPAAAHAQHGYETLIQVNGAAVFNGVAVGHEADQSLNVLTSIHAVGNAQTFRVWIDGVWHAGTLARADGVNSLALLHVAGPFPHIGTARLCPDEVPVGCQVKFCGFEPPRFGFVCIPTVRDRSDSFRWHRFRFRGVAGMIGGGLYTWDGRFLVGLHTRGVDGVSEVVPSPVIAKQLIAWGYEVDGFTSPVPQTEPAEPEPLPAIERPSEQKQEPEKPQEPTTDTRQQAELLIAEERERIEAAKAEAERRDRVLYEAIIGLKGRIDAIPPPTPIVISPAPEPTSGTPGNPPVEPPPTRSAPGGSLIDGAKRWAWSALAEWTAAELGIAATGWGGLAVGAGWMLARRWRKRRQAAPEKPRPEEPPKQPKPDRPATGSVPDCGCPDDSKQIIRSLDEIMAKLKAEEHERQQSRKKAEEQPTKQQEAAQKGGEPADANKFPNDRTPTTAVPRRNVDELRQIVRHGQLDGHDPLLDAAFGMFVQDETESLLGDVDTPPETRTVIENLLRRVRDRVDRAAPLSVHQTS